MRAAICVGCARGVADVPRSSSAA